MIQQAFGDQSLSHARVFQWHAQLKTVRTSVDDDKHTARPTRCANPETVTWIQELVRQDWCWTIQDIAEEVRIGYGTCQRVLTEVLGMHRVTAKFMPRILTADQKQQHINVCTELRQLASDDETLSRVISGDESWVYGYNSETKQQSSQWKSPMSPRPKKARQVKSNVKSMIITFFDVKGIVHKNLSQQAKLWILGSTAMFCGDCMKTYEDVAPNFGKNRPGCCTMTMQNKNKNKMAVISHLPYSPDLAPCDFFLFPKMKLKQKGRWFDTIEEIQAKMQRVLDTVIEKDFQEVFKKWRRRWDQCLHAGGNYFEGDGGQ